MTRVSIVIPTRNRAHLLRYAIPSALRQTYDDLEVIVSDNCSLDDTASVVERFSHPRLRYVRTPEPLSMPDSWEFAYRHATGDFITYLTDDSYLLPHALRWALDCMADLSVEVVVWNYAAYYSTDWLEPIWRNILYVPPSSFTSCVVQSRDCLRRMFDLEAAPIVPKFLNSLCARSVADRALRVQGRLFLPPCPDYSVAVGLLQQVERYAYIDSPLWVDGKFPQSIGAVSLFNWGKATQEYLREFGKKLDFVKVIDLDIPTVAVSIAQSLEMMKRFYPETLPFTINIRRLVCSSVRELVCRRDNGGETFGAWKVLEEYLLRQPPEVRSAASWQRIRAGLSVVLKRIRLLPFWGLLERLRGIVVLRGSQAGFRDLQECGQVAAALVANLTSRARSRDKMRCSPAGMLRLMGSKLSRGSSLGER